MRQDTGQRDGAIKLVAKPGKLLVRQTRDAHEYIHNWVRGQWDFAEVDIVGQHFSSDSLASARDKTSWL